MKDQYNRNLDYLRISVTDRCNLRCLYCMPEDGIETVGHEDILRFEEIERLANIFAGLGVNKVRVTGGEPFVRKGLIDFLARLKNIIPEIYITTNGVYTHKYIDQLQALGISGLNLSLDSLRENTFKSMTRSRGNEFREVQKSIKAILDAGMPLKINTVVQSYNILELPEIAALSIDNNLDIRFIEQMPFNGCLQNDSTNKDSVYNQESILNKIKSKYPDITELDFHSTAQLYQIPKAKGRVGIIAAESRTFCNSCSRLRLTAQGAFKTCLYGPDMLDLKTMLRQGYDDKYIKALIEAVAYNKPQDGFEAEQMRRNFFKEQDYFASMATIGG